MGIPIQLPMLALLAAGLGTGGAKADSETSFATQFSTTTGWTSNAGNDAFEFESLFSQHSGAVTGIVQGRDFVLRGSIDGSQTLFLDADYENDRGAGAEVELDYQFAPQTAMRGSIRLALNETGSALDFFGFGIPTLTLSRQLDADLTLAQTWDRLEVALDLGYTAITNGESLFVGLPIARQRLDPDVNLYAVGARAAYRLDGSMALLAEAGWRHVDIPALDQVMFGRQPVSAIRLAAGAQVGDSGTQIMAKGGADILMAAAMPGTMQLLPYAEIEGSWSLSDSFGLDAEASAQTYVRAPVDGIADWTLAASAGAHWLPLDGIVVSASAFAEQDYLSDGQTLIEVRRGVEVGANKAVGDNVDVGINFSLADTEYAGGGFRTARLGLDLNAVM